MSRQPEVGEVDVVASRGVREQDVRRLDVAVHEPVGVGGVECLADAVDDHRRPRRLEAGPGASSRLRRSVPSTKRIAMYSTPSASPIA